MYARNLSIHLKPDSLKLFNEKLETEVMPLLGTQVGFKYLVMFSDGDRIRVTTITLWDSAAHGDQYGADCYSQVMELLKPVINYTETAESGNCKVMV